MIEPVKLLVINSCAAKRALEPIILRQERQVQKLILCNTLALWKIGQIPLYPPFKKGERTSPPFEKGRRGGI